MKCLLRWNRVLRWSVRSWSCLSEGRVYYCILFHFVVDVFSNAANRAKGSGLGMYLVKSQVESYCGSVWVENRVRGEYNEGSRFVVMLPAVE
ncbi:hypothetical protein MCP_1609 [Methanocella paludicola SANAE]|uniref:Histidine kinase n=1 Tax=Methanocella paludicola (strain DSM 17711 / JCM 13418 / NBRC 101707 / SANAE) TaxID=304371 RepID=D1YZ09_METPS|nr:hypothetical protein MCP_1609 [Methanocella paludicola SANAE]